MLQGREEVPVPVVVPSLGFLGNMKMSFTCSDLRGEDLVVPRQHGSEFHMFRYM